MRLSQDQDALFLKNKRNADLICTLLIAGFVMVALSVYLFEFVDKHPKQKATISNHHLIFCSTIAYLVWILDS